MENKQIAFGAAAVVSALLAGYLFMGGSSTAEKTEKKKVEKAIKSECFDGEEVVQALKKYYESKMGKTHLKSLLQDAERNKGLLMSDKSGKIHMDLTHCKIDDEGMKLLKDLYTSKNIGQKLKDMFSGKKINTTEGRSVLHTALRRPKDQTLVVDGKDVVKDVHEVLYRIKTFSEKVRNGTFKGFTGKKIKNVVAIGIGGSFLGPEFVFEALR